MVLAPLAAHLAGDGDDGVVVAANASEPVFLAERSTTTMATTVAPTSEAPTTTAATATTVAPATTAPTSTTAPATTAAPSTAPTTTAAPARPPTTEAPAPSTTVAARAYSDPRSTDVWHDLAQCESGGRWDIDTGNGYYGGLQFSLASWQLVGGTGYPHEHPAATQIEMGRRLQARQGWQAWPHCSAELGLR